MNHRAPFGRPRRLLLLAGLFFASIQLANPEKPNLIERPNADSGPTQVSVAIWIVDINSIDSAQQQAELANFEFEESPSYDRVSTRDVETILKRAERVFVSATSLASDSACDDWQQLRAAVQMVESELQNDVSNC